MPAIFRNQSQPDQTAEPMALSNDPHPAGFSLLSIDESKLVHPPGAYFAPGEASAVYERQRSRLKNQQATLHLKGQASPGKCPFRL